jgi:phosphoribosyl-ATP pyrophosphohydrolase/phosphoribosyl-AMP cyclohydrolase
MVIDELAWGESGLLPVVVQDADSGAVLTLAYANREALERAVAERTTWLYSRSRAALWMKGETSGHTQALVSVAYDCDADALLYRVRPSGPACHTGADTCFYRELLSAPEEANARATGRPFAAAIEHLATTIAGRRELYDETLARRCRSDWEEDR